MTTEPSPSEKMKTLADAEEAKDSADQTEAMRFLEKRLRQKVIEVPMYLPDSDEKYVFRIRPLSVSEQNRFNEIRSELQDLGILRDEKGNPVLKNGKPVSKLIPPEKIRPYNQEISRLLASICYDKALDYDYWLGKHGHYDPEDSALLLSAAARITFADEEKLRFFLVAKPDKVSSSS